MRLLANLLWFLFAGVWLAIGYFTAGVIQCLTIIGLPFGVQSFKLALYVIWPFGRVVVSDPQSGGALSTIGNILWIVLGGIWLALGHLVAGLVLCLTIIGIPFGVACIRLAGLALAPFGKVVLTRSEAQRLQRPVAYTLPAR